MADSWIEKFKREAVPKIVNEFKPEKILLFGSRMLGADREESDIDVIIVSKMFEDIPFVRRMPLILKMLRFKKHIDVICYFRRLCGKRFCCDYGFNGG